MIEKLRDCEHLSVKDLTEVCKFKMISGYSSWKKADKIENCCNLHKRTFDEDKYDKTELIGEDGARFDAWRKTVVCQVWMGRVRVCFCFFFVEKNQKDRLENYQDSRVSCRRMVWLLQGIRGCSKHGILIIKTSNPKLEAFRKTPVILCSA